MKILELLNIYYRTESTSLDQLFKDLKEDDSEIPLHAQRAIKFVSFLLDKGV